MKKLDSLKKIIDLKIKSKKTEVLKKYTKIAGDLIEKFIPGDSLIPIVERLVPAESLIPIVNKFLRKLIISKGKDPDYVIPPPPPTPERPKPSLIYEGPVFSRDSTPTRRQFSFIDPQPSWVKASFKDPTKHIGYRKPITVIEKPLYVTSPMEVLEVVLPDEDFMTSLPETSDMSHFDKIKESKKLSPKEIFDIFNTSENTSNLSKIIKLAKITNEEIELQSKQDVLDKSIKDLMEFKKSYDNKKDLPTSADLKSWKDVFENAQADKDFKIFTHAPVDVKRNSSNSKAKKVATKKSSKKVVKKPVKKISKKSVRKK